MALGVYTKVLKDDFNRTNEDPATGWTDNEAAGLRIVSNELDSAGGSGYWTADNPLGDFEAYLVIGTAPNSSDYLKFRSDGTNFYQFNWGNGDVKEFPGDTLLFTTTAHTVVSTDEWAVQCIGSSIELFVNGVSQGSGSDATVASGRFEVVTFGTASYNSFSLGTEVPVTTTILPRMMVVN